MNIFRKLIRYFDFSMPPGKSFLSRYGEAAENFLRNILSKSGYLYYFNKLVPDRKKCKFYGEIDAVIYGEGNIYCVEVKRYKGVIAFPQKVKVITKKSLIFKREIKMESEEIDYSKIAVYRNARDYEELRASYPNPMLKTKFLTRKLKEYLIGKDKRFLKVPFIPVVVFCDGDSDISQIHSFDKGFIYISEILNFIKFHKNKKFAKIYQSWIKDGIESLPTWDYIKNTEEEWIHGELVGDEFSCRTREGTTYRIPYCDVRAIFVHDFDSYYLLVIKKLDGGSEEIFATKGKVKINNFDSILEFSLKHIKEIYVGRKNFMFD
ncbi:nuclease-related domain-containing protein [Desulfurobacterium sp.]